MYYSGEGVPQDYVEAHKWRNLAASRASTEDRKRYADARDAVAAVMTPQQIADAQQRATDWLTAFEQRN
jgi:TPR repeat protein